MAYNFFSFSGESNVYVFGRVFQSLFLVGMCATTKFITLN